MQTRIAASVCFVVGMLFTQSVWAYDTPESKVCNNGTGACISGNDTAGDAIGVQGLGGTYGVYGQGRQGVYGLMSTGGTAGVKGEATGTYGVWGVDNGSGNGVEGNSSTGSGVYGSSAGYGVYGTSSSSSAIYGSLNNSTGAAGDFHQAGSGPGVYTVSNSGHGVEAYGSTALWGNSTTGDQTGVYGYGSSYGVRGESAVWGVYGYGTGSGSSRGVVGNASGTGTIGVLGECSGTSCIAVYASGNLAYTGTLQNLSDERLKKDILPLKGSMDKLLQLRGVSYYWKDPAKHGNNAGVQRGFVAQEYEKAFPEWVSTDNDGYKMISTGGLDALEVESIRQLKVDNDDLRARLSKLEGQRNPIGTNTMGWAVAGLALAATLIVSRKKEKQTKNA